MADKDTWEDELGAFGREEQEQSDDSAETGAAEKSGFGAEPSPDDRENTADAEFGSVKETNQEPSNRARRAQRTRRVRLNNQQAGAGASAAQPSPPSPSALANSAVELPGPPPNSPVSAKPTNPSTQLKLSGPNKNNPKPRNNPSLGKSSSTETTNPLPSSTPITIPPQVSGFQGQNGEGFDCEEDEPSRILAGLCCMAEGVVNAFRGAWHMTKGLMASAKIIPFPAVFGAVLYVGVVYLLGTYIFNTDDVSYLEGFEKSVKFTLLSAGWVMLPLFSAFVVIHFDTSGTKHHQFLYESVLDAVIQVFNALIMTAHAGPDSLVWLAPIFVVSAMFRLLYWLSLFYFGHKWNQIFKTPAVVNSIVLSAFNIGASLRHYADGLSSSVPASDPPVTEVPTEIPIETKGQGMIYSPTVCQLMEKVFCGVENTN